MALVVLGGALGGVAHADDHLQGRLLVLARTEIGDDAVAFDAHKERRGSSA